MTYNAEIKKKCAPLKKRQILQNWLIIGHKKTQNDN